MSSDQEMGGAIFIIIALLCLGFGGYRYYSHSSQSSGPSVMAKIVEVGTKVERVPDSYKIYYKPRLKVSYQVEGRSYERQVDLDHKYGDGDEVRAKYTGQEMKIYYDRSDPTKMYAPASHNWWMTGGALAFGIVLALVGIAAFTPGLKEYVKIQPSRG